MCTFGQVDASGRVLSLWSPQVSGDYAKDCAAGRRYADEAVGIMVAEAKPALLGWILREFNKDPARRGVETGFCHRIAELTMT